MSRAAVAIILSEAQRRELEGLARRRKTGSRAGAAGADRSGSGGRAGEQGDRRAGGGGREHGQQVAPALRRAWA